MHTVVLVGGRFVELGYPLGVHTVERGNQLLGVHTVVLVGVRTVELGYPLGVHTVVGRGNQVGVRTVVWGVYIVPLEVALVLVGKAVTPLARTLRCCSWDRLVLELALVLVDILALVPPLALGRELALVLVSYS